MNCPACETKNPDRAKYCLECGQRLPASRTVSSPDRTGFRRRVAAAVAPVARDEGERRPAVLVCAEIAGPPAGADGTDAGLRDRLADLFRRFEAAVERAGGIIDRFHGSQMTAVFGVPEAHEDDGARAVRCALALQEAFVEGEAAHAQAEGGHRGAKARGRRAPARARKSDRPALSLRIGIHGGEVHFGGGARGVSGDVLAVAQHLMAIADPGAVLVSRPLQRPLQPHFRFRPLPPLHLRGRERFVHPFRLLGPQRTPSHFLTPFVGRELTLARLLEHFTQAAAQSRPRFVLVEGAAGMGKSRLVFELRQQLLDFPQAVTVLQGRCLPHGVTPFGPFGEMLRARLGIEAHASATDTLARLESLCARVFPGDPLAPHYLALVLGCRPEVSPLAFMDVRDAHAGAHYTLKRLLEGLAGGRVPAGRTLLKEAAEFVSRVERVSKRRPAGVAAGHAPHFGGEAEAPASAPAASRPAIAPELLDVLTPLVLVIEDCHWLDADSLGLLVYLTQTPFYGPILVVGVGRPEGAVKDFLSGKRAGSERWEAHHLEPLHPTASAQVVTAMCQGRMLPAGMLEKLLAVSAGSPFHLEELLKWMLQQPGPPPSDAGRVPRSVADVLAARIQALPPERRETLLVAAVMGRLFWRSCVEAVLGRPVDEDLRALEASAMVFELGDSLFPAGGAQHIFKNELLREAAYRTLPEARRVELHAATWGYFAALDPQVVHDHPRLRLFAAHHAVEAGELRSAFTLYVQAGDQARAARSDLEALEAYAKALALGDRVAPLPAEWAAERVAVLEKHALTLADLRQFDEAEAEFERALTQVAGAEDRARLEANIGALYGAQGKLRAATRHFRAGLDHLGRRASPLAGRLKLDLAEALTEGREDLEQAAKLAGQALAAAEAKGGSPELQARAWQVLGTLAWMSGKPEDAVRHIQRVQKAHHASDDPGARCRSLHLLGRVHVAQGNLKKALEQFREHLALGERFGYEREVEAACLAIGDVERLQGRYEPARVSAERAAGIALELGEPRGVARASLLLARILGEQGEPEGGRQLAESALSLFETVQDPIGTGEVRGEFARHFLTRGDFVAARAHAEAYVAAAEGARDPRMAADAGSLLGTVLFEAGDRARGTKYLQRALHIVDQVQDIPCWTRCTHRLARALFVDQQLSLALELAKSASFAALNMELAPELGAIQALLAEIYLDNGLTADAIHSARKSLHQLAGCEGGPARVPALRVCGHALRKAGREEEGQFRLREAERLAERLGMKGEATGEEETAQR